MITTTNLLPILARVFGLPVDLQSEEVQDDGQVLVVWSTRLPTGEMRFERDPPLLISADRQTLTWAKGRRELAFTLKDLEDVDPTSEANRHPQTRALALRLTERLQATNLSSPSGAAALAAALDELPLHPSSTAALLASATGHDFWELEKHALFAHEYRDRQTQAPYSAEEEAAAREIVREPWFAEALRDKPKDFFKNVYLPVVAAEDTEAFCLAARYPAPRSPC